MRKEISHTIESKIARDAIAVTSDALRSQPHYLSGGTAVQMYLPRRRHRPTRDIDLTLEGSMGGPRFREAFTPVAIALQEQGYQATLGKKRHGYYLHLEDETDMIDIQIRRQNTQHVAKYEATNERELDHVRTHAPYWSRASIKTLSPEDLILRKLLRITRFEQDYQLQPRPWSYNPTQQLANIKGFRKPFLDAIGDGVNAHAPEIAKAIALIRMQADLYDIEVLLRFQEIDKEYFKEGLHEYQTLQRKRGAIIDLLDSLSCDRQGIGFEDAFPDERDCDLA